jgi:hypothetical protein
MQFGMPSEFGSAGWWRYFAISDTLFLIDCVSGFFTSYTNAHDVEITDPRKTAENYARTALLLDALSSIPFALISGEPSQDDEDADQDGFALNKMLRVLKLGKLIRVLRAQRSFRSLDVMYVSTRLPALQVGFVVLQLLFYVHVAGCFYLVTDLAHDLDDLPPGSRYTHACMRAFALSLGSVAFESGDNGLREDSGWAAWAVTMYLVCGVLMANYSTCSLMVFAFDLRELVRERRKKRQNIKALLSERHVPIGLRRSIIRHFDYLCDAKGESGGWRALMTDVPQQLRTRLIMHTHKRYLSLPLFLAFERYAAYQPGGSQVIKAGFYPAAVPLPPIFASGCARALTSEVRARKSDHSCPSHVHV